MLVGLNPDSMHNLMVKLLDTTLSRVIKLRLADSGVRGVLSKAKSTTLIQHLLDVWKILIQRNIPSQTVIQMGTNIGATHLVEFQLSLMNRIPHSKMGDQEFEVVNEFEHMDLYMRDLYICVTYVGRSL